MEKINLLVKCTEDNMGTYFKRKYNYETIGQTNKFYYFMFGNTKIKAPKFCFMVIDIDDEQKD